MKLKNKKLLKDKAYIDGVWVDGPARYDVTNPADGEVIGCAPDLGAGETRAAIAAAEKAFPAWAKKTAKERAAILRRWYELIVEHVDDLAVILTTEQGKPLAEAKGRFCMGPALLSGLPRKASGFTATLSPHRLPGHGLAFYASL